VAAFRGDDENARAGAEAVLAVAAARGLKWRAVAALLALGWLELGRRRWSAALDRFDQAAATNAASAARAAFDRVEAAVGGGGHATAREAAAGFESWATRTGAAWAPPRVEASRALLSRGEQATEHFEAALRLIQDTRPFDRARIQLLYGEHLRRERRRADARVQLRRAIEGFERLRATPWAERAVAELRASGESARRRDPSTLDELTPKETQITRLVGQGLSNKEVAAQLFLSPRTIDYHLRNVFAKLGLTSRTQLARLAASEQAETP
jgi:DNA-binding CsgD family transcriptional regulator